MILDPSLVRLLAAAERILTQESDDNYVHVNGEWERHSRQDSRSYWRDIRTRHSLGHLQYDECKTYLRIHTTQKIVWLQDSHTRHSDRTGETPIMVASLGSWYFRGSNRYPRQLEVVEYAEEGAPFTQYKWGSKRNPDARMILLDRKCCAGLVPVYWKPMAWALVLGTADSHSPLHVLRCNIHVLQQILAMSAPNDAEQVRYVLDFCWNNKPQN